MKSRTEKIVGVFVILALSALIGVFGFYAIGCAHVPVAGTSTCADACARGSALRCEWATPTPSGVTCEEVCTNADNVGLSWRKDCLATTNSCDPTACP